jgi:RNA polymerase sigma-70 factor (ECF subfamily)
MSGAQQSVVTFPPRTETRRRHSRARPAQDPTRETTGSIRPRSDAAKRDGVFGMQRTDEELVVLSTAGDAESFNQLVLRWERPVFALAYRVLGREEDARDVCQETFLRAFRALNGFKGQAKFSSWLYRIALNLCRDWIRRERRSPMITPLDDETEPAPLHGAAETAEELAVRRDLGRVITRAMSALSEAQRTTIVLKEYHGLTFQEIADLQGCPLSTVKTRLYQGLGVLRRQLQRTGIQRPDCIIGFPARVMMAKSSHKVVNLDR